MTLQYSQEVRQRIARQGAIDITSFLDDVPQEIRENAYARLTVGGFRQGSTAEFKETERRFVAFLARGGATRQAASQWTVFAKLWVERGATVFGSTFLELPAIRNDAASEPSPGAGHAFLEQLASSYGTLGAAREDIERLFVFSAYQDDPQVEQALAKFPPREQLKKARVLEALPNEIGAIRSTLTGLLTELQTLQGALAAVSSTATDANDRTHAVEARSDGLIRESAELRRLIEIVEQGQELLRAGVERLTKQLDRSETAAEEAQALMSARFDQITDRASSLEVGVGSLTEAVQGAQAAAEAASVAVAQIRLTLDAPSPTIAPATGGRPVIAVPPPMAILTPGLLGTALFKAAPAGNDGQPRLLVIDAAVRARELPLLMGALAREFAEAWIGIAGGPDPIVLLTDPTLLSLEELTPSGSRGGRAPLARAFARAAATPDRPVLVLLDDFDPAAASFWLPELARGFRQPARYGFPTNLLFLAVLEADPEQMALTHARAGELFPVTFDDCTPTAAASPPGRPIEAGELDIDLIVAPGIGSAWRDRVAAFVEAARATFAEDDRRQLAAGFASYLQFAKGAAEKPRSPGALATRLVEAARLITRAQSEA